MNNESESDVTEIILVGFSHNLQTQRLLLGFSLLMYKLTVFGNIILTCIIITSPPHLHTPMYYFLCNLSFLDFFYSTGTVPKLLQDLISTGGGRISHTGCLLQLLSSLFLGQTECILLGVMAYDRYIAICFPLRYMVIMSWKKCNTIAITVWTGTFLNVTVPMIIKPPKFCKNTNINHYFCEVIVVLKLICENRFYENIVTIATLFSTLIPLGFILLSYICIIRAVLKIHSAAGRNKTFSTCASHLTVVFMFYGASMTMYLGATKNPSTKTKFISLMYMVVTPMLNPMIYSLRNNDVKRKRPEMLADIILNIYIFCYLKLKTLWARFNSVR
uniref:Olfactory receptor n=1 Tax=Leptobrachium leishanense TaxID=445787 RepID=A0A8C5P9Y5_9ANUR